MKKQGLIPTNNLKHNVAALMVRAPKSLTDLARVYFLTEVAAKPERRSRRRSVTWRGSLLSISSFMATTVRTSGTAR